MLHFEFTSELVGFWQARIAEVRVDLKISSSKLTAVPYKATQFPRRYLKQSLI